MPPPDYIREAAKASYPVATIPEPFQILGLTLKPFCLGHYWIMERFGVAFAGDEPKEPDTADLLLSALICSMTFEEFIGFMHEKDFLEQVKQWGADCREFVPGDKIELFKKYMKAAFDAPEVVFNGDCRQSGAHWSQTVFTCLTNQCGYSASEATNLPLARALHDFYKSAESNGLATILPRGTQIIQDPDGTLEASIMEELKQAHGGPSFVPPPADFSSAQKYADIFKEASCHN